MNQIEAKIQGLKQKLSEQLDSMSDDEDFLNIRTEAEELMNDLGEDVNQVFSFFSFILSFTHSIFTFFFHFILSKQFF